MSEMECARQARAVLVAGILLAGVVCAGAQAGPGSAVPPPPPPMNAETDVPTDGSPEPDESPGTAPSAVPSTVSIPFDQPVPDTPGKAGGGTESPGEVSPGSEHPGGGGTGGTGEAAGSGESSTHPGSEGTETKAAGGKGGKGKSGTATKGAKKGAGDDPATDESPDPEEPDDDSDGATAVDTGPSAAPRNTALGQAQYRELQAQYDRARAELIKMLRHNPRAAKRPSRAQIASQRAKVDQIAKQLALVAHTQPDFIPLAVRKEAEREQARSRKLKAQMEAHEKEMKRILAQRAEAQRKAQVPPKETTQSSKRKMRVMISIH